MAEAQPKMDYSLHSPTLDDLLFIPSNDSGSDKEKMMEDDNKKDKDGDDGDEDGGTEASEDEDDEDGRGESTMLQVCGLNSGMTQSVLKSYVSEQIQGLKEMEELFVEKDTLPQTQTVILHFESLETAQSACSVLSKCPLGPGGDLIKVEILDTTETQQDLATEQKNPTRKAADKPKKRQPRARQWRQKDKTLKKIPAIGGGLDAASSATLEVNNVSIKKEEFEKLLSQLKIESQSLVWKPPPQIGSVFLQFESKQEAATSQRILNNISVGAANKKLVAKLVQPKQKNGKESGKVPGRAPSSSQPLQTSPASISTNRDEKYNRQDSSRKYSKGGHIGVSWQRPNPPDGTWFKSSDGRRHSQDGGQRGPSKIPPQMEVPIQPSGYGQRERRSVGDDEDRKSTVLDASNTSASTFTTSIEVTNIHPNVMEAGFRLFLHDKKIPYIKLEFVTSPKQEKWAVLYFATTRDTAQSRKFLDKQWIVPGGPKLRANFTVASNTNDYPPTADGEDRPNCLIKGTSGGPPRHPCGGGNRGGGGRSRSRNRPRKDDADSDRFSESSEAMSTASRKSFSSSTRGGRHHVKSLSLYITNIGNDCDKEEFCDFLRSFDLQCECSEFGQTKNKAQFAVIHFPDCKKAAEAKKVLDQDEWLLGGNTPLKVSFFRPRQASTRRQDSLVKQLSQLPVDNDESQRNVQKWLEGQTGPETSDQNSKQNIPPTRPVKSGNINLPLKKRESNPNEVVITDLPRDIFETDVADILTKEDCQGFIDVRLIKNKVSRTGTGECFITFRERKHAMEAVLKLYGRSIHDHRCEVRLSVNHDQMEPAIARKTLATFQEKEMPEKVKDIQSAIEKKIEKIEADIKELEDTLEENQSFAQLEHSESSIEALRHQLNEQDRYLEEFKRACRSVDIRVKHLQVKDVIALHDVQKIRHRFERECRRAESPLPVYGYRSDIQRKIQENMAFVLQGETGSGKSTQIPQYIVDMELQGHQDDCDTATGGGQQWRVVCTQPRRVAALTLAKRVAEEYGCRVGEEVGFVVGNKKSVNKSSTVVTFMTDRKLLNVCMADPKLSEYSCVIVDEAHERSVDTDILLATLKKLLMKRRDLHLIVMSATIDINLFTTYFGGCAQLSVPGRTFPVDKHWCGDNLGIGEGDYLKKAIEQAAKVHKKEGPGDILVFLTSVNEIERACRDLATILGQNAANEDGPVLILPLHGRLQPEDQMKVFKETRPDQRKIVFATNVAETSVTIKGIKYVIDTGVVKECQYDPKRSMSLLKVTTITKASAQQRAGRAGRTAPGVCYRLYTKEEYGELEETMKPEILRVHLGMAALQLLELGVEDVANFDFIEAPDQEATRQAMITLRLLGAVDKSSKLTPLGKKMATLPLEPRLSKLVLEGVERGLVTEAVVLAALISAPGSIFYRGGSDKDKDTADQLKLKFCHKSGDIITMLTAYSQWNDQPEKQRKSWCMANSMNSKTLNAVKDTVQEVRQVLKKEHKVDSDYSKMKIPDKAKSETLQKVIMAGYFQTLSLYNGHHRAGYTVLPQQKSGHVHPSSALKALGINPTWVVYEEFKRTSRDFLFNVTQVEISWLEEVAPVFYHEIDLKALKDMAMIELSPIPLGTALMRQLTVKRNEKLRALEEKITAEQDSSCIIEVNRSTKHLQMFVNKQCSSFATSHVKGFLDDECKMIERQQVEVPVGDSGVVRQVVVAGAETKFILMAKDYRTLEISNMPDDATDDDVERIIRFAGCSRQEILDVYRFPPQTPMAKAGKWGRVTFISPEAAQDAKEWLDVAVAAEETTLTARPMQGRGFQRPDIRRVNTRLVITWFTWPSKGHAFVNCETTVEAMDLRLAVTGVHLKGRILLCNTTKKDSRAVFIKNVHPDATQDDLERAIKRKTAIPFKRCSIARQEPTGHIPTPEEVTNDIYTMFDGAVEQQDMNVNVLPVRSEKTQMQKAIVTFSGDNEGQVDARVAELQQNPRRNSAGQVYHAKITASCMLFCRPEVYSCLEEEIQRLVETAKTEKEGLSIRVNKSRKTSDWVISIASGKIEDVQTVRRSLLVYVQGETVPLSDLYHSVTSYQKKTKLLEMLQKALQHLLQDLDAYATVDGRRQAVVFFGKDQIRERLKRRFRDYTEIVCNQMLREIPLTASVSPHCTKGRAIRALVKAYGPWLKDLQEKSGASIVMNTKLGVLLIEGNQKVFDKVHGMVYNCLKEAGLEEAISNEAQQPCEDIECGVCYTSIDSSDEVYRLSACSQAHGFHQECLIEMFKVRLKDSSKDYPIECPSEGCGQAMLLCDIRILCPEEDKRLRLYQLALEAHVAQRSDGKLKFCPTADCCMIYRHTEDAQTFVCPECRARLCSSCAAEPHPGQTCEQFKKLGKTFDDIKEWIKETGADAKMCPVPNCGYVIEKISGCHHMTCLGCGKHICWMCLQYFNTGRACYGHLQQVHGNFV
ncbi:ATP-dependent RNA helicase DEAH12, chloroplastic-like [Acanthaster planci]|uniref:RNA helicase n=1 Tax=Acanthaster planci TaxID=133434 RepID=A0A8B7XH37_ACAPL|nr:ATP-dependent RNA helicase DEAH12, chloroplastic-like [Acanthaster planci]